MALCQCGHELESHPDDWCEDEDCYCDEFVELTKEQARTRDSLISILRDLKPIIEENKKLRLRFPYKEEYGLPLIRQTECSFTLDDRHESVIRFTIKTEK